MLVVAKK